MIYVERHARSTPPSLRPGGQGAAEQAQAVQHYLHGDPVKPDFAAYADPMVKLALLTLFHGKCAYCETLCAAVEDVDVEHYRPKGGIVDDSGVYRTPGYYWLAADWRNLFPSCSRCNQIRVSTEVSDGTVGRTGKGNYFPLRNEQKRATKPGEEDTEEPLLLNPCVHNPEEHLRFNPDGTVSHLSREGEESIKTYGLHRRWLKQAREQRSLLIQDTIRQIRSGVRAIQKLKTAALDYGGELEDLIIGVRRLVQVTDASQEYAALARGLINPFRNEILHFTEEQMVRGA